MVLKFSVSITLILYIEAISAVSPPHYSPTPTPHYSPSPTPHYGPTPTPYSAHPPPHYGHHAASGYGYTPVPHPYGPLPAGAAGLHKKDYGPPACTKNTTKTWCLIDYEYPTYEIQHAVEYHYAAVAALYKDVIANTENSVDRLKDIKDETYLCPSHTDYVMPLRAINTEGKWRIIVNNVKAHYETLSQTARLEECHHAGHPCPLVPECYPTKCVQKSIYHRFLIYDPYDYYFPFAIESFKLPASCACYNGGYAEEPHHYKKKPYHH